MISITILSVVCLLLFVLEKISKKRNGVFYLFLLRLKNSLPKVAFFLKKYFLAFIRIFSCFLIVFWPLVFWFWYYQQFGQVPIMGIDDLSYLFGIDLEKYEISRWWDQVFWLIMLLFLAGTMEVSSWHKSFENINFLLLGIIFIFFSILFLCGPIYILILFVVTLFIYFTFIWFIYSKRSPIKDF